MASGKLGAARLAAATETVIYTVPVGTVATVNVNVCNADTGAATTIKLAIGTGGASAAADLVEAATDLIAKGVLERTGLVMAAGEKLFATSPGANVTVRAHGYEEAA